MARRAPTAPATCPVIVVGERTCSLPPDHPDSTTHIAIIGQTKYQLSGWPAARPRSTVRP